jgi:hypothetical protein
VVLYQRLKLCMQLEARLRRTKNRWHRQSHEGHRPAQSRRPAPRSCTLVPFLAACLAAAFTSTKRLRTQVTRPGDSLHHRLTSTCQLVAGLC